MKKIKQLATGIINNLKSHIKKIDYICWSVIILCLIISGNTFLFVVRFNEDILVVIIALSLFLFWLCKKQFLSKDVSITIGTISIAILIFSFQIASAETSKENSIITANTYNCLVAQSIMSIGGTDAHFPLASFVFEPYLDNLAELYDMYGQTNGNKVLEASYSMEPANNLLAVVDGIETKGITTPLDANSVGMFNSQLNRFAISIQDNVCSMTLLKHSVYLALLNRSIVLFHWLKSIF